MNKLSGIVVLVCGLAVSACKVTGVAPRDTDISPSNHYGVSGP